MRNAGVALTISPPAASLCLFSLLTEAEIVRLFLSQSTLLRGQIRKELNVNGCLLVLSVLKGAGARAGKRVVGSGQGQSRPRRSHNGGLSLKEKCGALGLSVCGDGGRTCLTEFHFPSLLTD